MAAFAAAALDEDELRLFQLVNQERAARNLPLLVWHDDLYEAADQHSQEMIDYDYFSHISEVDDSTPYDRVVRTGYYDDYLGRRVVRENIYIKSGGPDPDKAHEAWMDSPGHRANILAEDINEMGAGCYSGEYQGWNPAWDCTEVFAYYERGEGEGDNDECPNGPDCKHNVCKNSQCVEVLTRGEDECQTNEDCELPTHYACWRGTCAKLTGSGPDTCSVNDDCRHTACTGAGQCIEVLQSGADECETSADCAAPTHKECLDGMCTVVSGAGPNSCLTIGDCRHTMCTGDGRCVEILQPGTNECLSQYDCAMPTTTHNACVSEMCVPLAGAGSNECTSDADCKKAIGDEGIDTDDDGFPDIRDACPAEPETFNGYRDWDGCPDEVPETKFTITNITETLPKEEEHECGNHVCEGNFENCTSCPADCPCIWTVPKYENPEITTPELSLGLDKINPVIWIAIVLLATVMIILFVAIHHVRRGEENRLRELRKRNKPIA